MATLDKLKEVRARSGVGLNECSTALDEAGDDVEKAIEVLLKKGQIRAADRAGRIATEGTIYTYVHGGGSKVAVVEINCETDFAAKSDAFREFCEHVAMHIVAAAPTYLSPSDVSPAVLSHYEAVFMGQVPSDKPAQARAKIIEGKVKKWYSEVCLLEQESVVQPGKTIEQLRTELVAKLGENVTIRRFIRWELGEGLGA